VSTAPEGDPAGPRREDDAIVVGYLRGDPSAVASIDGWIAAAAAPFRRRLGADWPDLQQDARIEILRLLRASSWRGEARLRTYVWRVVGHSCLDALRRQRRRPAGEPEEEGASLVSPAPSPLEGLLAQDAGRILLTALRTLPEECREIWTRILRGSSWGWRRAPCGCAPTAAESARWRPSPVTHRPPAPPKDRDMDCEAATERLPWLYAGSLEPAEAAEVRRHLEGCERCRAELQQTRQAAAVFDAHLPSAVLVDVAWDRPVTAFADDLVQAHLDGCASCREELALLQESRRLEPQAEAAPVVRPVRWHKIALPATLAAGLAAGALWGRGTAPRTPVATDGPRVSALETEVQRLRATVGDLEARVRAAAGPRLNLPIFEILPGSAVVRGTAEPGTVVEIPADAQEIALLLAADGPAGGPAALVVRHADGREVWQGEGLRYAPPGGYVVTLPAALLPDGSYVLTVQPQRVRASTYAVRVRRAG
jgi:RNA polymerase sigma factor (sigma-70 family)